MRESEEVTYPFLLVDDLDGHRLLELVKVAGAMPAGVGGRLVEQHGVALVVVVGGGAGAGGVGVFGVVMIVVVVSLS